MGQEERRNKAKLEKTQISLATSNTEYENAVKALEETTVRWNREWKAAADKFQDLEEERLDFTKSSLWTFANIASTVCVSDDASCEKIRLSLEKMEVEKDIATFISERGTGQEIPDAPKYINFCRGDVNDSQSETSDDDHYSVAQFPRSINPAFRSSSPQPSTFESHHDPNSPLAQDLAHRDMAQPGSREATITPQKIAQDMRASMEEHRRGPPIQPSYDASQPPLAVVPHDPYPMDGMTMLCRTGPLSDRSSQVVSREDFHSDYSNPTSMSSVEPASGKVSPVKQDVEATQSPEKKLFKKKSGFFQNHSPFRRKSTKEPSNPVESGRNTWSAGSPRRPQAYGSDGQSQIGRSASPEPIDANASLALGVGQNVLPVSTTETKQLRSHGAGRGAEDNDPIAQALAELKGVNLGKQGSVRMSADNYHGIATPAPGAHSAAAVNRGTPPPSYGSPAQVSRLGVPPPAVTSKAMKQASQKVASQTRSIFGEGREPSRPSTRGGYDMPRSASPAPNRSVSPQPRMTNDPRMGHRSASPNPYAQHQRSGSYNPPQKRGSDFGYYREASPRESVRDSSPASFRGDYNRPRSSFGGSDMAVQLAPAGDDMYASQRGRGDSRAMGLYEGNSRPRSKSVVDPSRQYTRDGRVILHFGKSCRAVPHPRVTKTDQFLARALYVYQAAIPEELGFSKGDMLAVLRHQDDGWWEAEVHNGNGRIGLVPSNYLQPC